MDEIDIFKTAGISTSGVAILLIVYRVAKSIQGKRLVSSCCGRRLEMGVDVEEMTPKEIVISNPALHQGKPPKASADATTGTGTGATA